MKVGSLVECVDDGFKPSEHQAKKMTRFPAKGEILTVRSISKCPIDNGVGLRFDEIVNGANPNTGNEMGYAVEMFREVQPPMDLSALLEETILETA